MTANPKSMNGNEWGLLILLSVLWGAGFFFVGVAIKELPPLTIALARVGLAGVMLLPVFWLYGHRMPTSVRAWMPFLVMGLLNNALPFSLLTAGQTQITVGLTSIINAMTPLFTVVVMAAFGEEKLTAYRIVGVLLGVLGVVILSGFDGSINVGQIFGIGLCLAATLSFGFAALWGRRHLEGVAPVKSATCQLICSSLIMLVVVAFVDRPWTLSTPTQEAVFSLLGLAFFGTAIAYIVFFQILVRAGASNVMLVTLLIPVSALVLGNLFLDEPIRVREIVGAVVIGSGLLFIDGRLIKLAKRVK